MDLQYNWMERYPWYVVISDFSILNTFVKNGVPMDIVWTELSSKTYIPLFIKNETFTDIKLSGNAKLFIDKKLYVSI